MAAGFLACAAPDLDFVVGYLGPIEYLLHHRGVTHSLVMLPLWALLYSWLLALILREPRGWRALYGVVALALGAHIAGDVITSFGTIVLAPFSDWRAAIGTTFIIDLWFSGIILAGLIGSAVFYKSRVPAMIGSVVLASYVGLQYAQRQEALALGRDYAAQSGVQNARVTAHPRPVSPFNWTVYVSDEQAHRFAHVNLIRKEPKRYEPGDGFFARLDAPYMPKDKAIWVVRRRYGEVDEAFSAEAWRSEPMAVYRWFADLPALDARTGNCAYFVDLRFDTPGRPSTPFRYGACRDAPGGAWRLVTS